MAGGSFPQIVDSDALGRPEANSMPKGVHSSGQKYLSLKEAMIRNRWQWVLEERPVAWQDALRHPRNWE